MKKLLRSLCLAAIILVSGAFATSAQTGALEKDIRAVMQFQQDAWNSGDLETFMIPYWNSDSLIFVGSRGPVYGWQQTLDNYKKNYDGPAKMGKLNFTLLRIKPLGKKYCQVVGQWQLKRDAGDVGGHFSLIFEKINGEWKIIADHSS